MQRPSLPFIVVTAIALSAASCGDEAQKGLAVATTGAGSGTGGAAGTGGGGGGAGPGAAGGAAPTTGTGGAGSATGGSATGGNATGGSPSCADAGPQSQACATDADCDSSSAPCPACPDGLHICTRFVCQSGACTPAPPACPTCTLADCGEGCHVHCDQNGCTEGVCDMNGQCVAAPGPACGPKCMVDTDCAQPSGPCTMCPGGSMACEQMACSSGYCQPTTPPCPVLTCAGQPCGTSCGDASQQIGQCNGVDTCVVGAPPSQQGFCAAGCRSPYDCPGGNAGWLSWDGCFGTDVATCIGGQCGHAPSVCTPSTPCEGLPAGKPCLPLCAEVGCPTPNPLPSAHCDAQGSCVVDPPPPCGASSCSKNSDCPTFKSPGWEPCVFPSPLGCLAPICAAGVCATFVTQARQTTCTPMDAHAGPTTCPSVHQGFAWDGTECVPVIWCACTGQDCDVLLPSLAVCKALHEQC